MPRTTKRGAGMTATAGTSPLRAPAVVLVLKKEAAYWLHLKILAQEPAEASSGSTAYILDKFLAHCK